MAIEGEFSKAFFEATFANFVNQIFERQLVATKIQMDLIRKLEGKTQVIGSHWQIIKHCRKSIQNLDTLLKDIKSYFTSLRIGDLYELFETMFRILVYDIKKLSECYLRRFQSTQLHGVEDFKYNKKKSMKSIQYIEDEKQRKLCICQMKNADKIKKIEHLDFQIAGIQAQEAAIQEQMVLLIKELDGQKAKFEKIDATSHHTVYQQIQKVFGDISRKAEAMFSNFLKGMCENKTKIAFLEPETFDEQVFIKLKKQISRISKTKISKLKQAVNTALRAKRNNSILTKSSDEIQNYSSLEALDNFKTKNLLRMKSQQICIDQAVDEQAQQQLKSTNLETQLTLKYKEIENLKKYNKLLNTEMVELREMMKTEQSERVRLLSQNKEIEAIFKKRMCQFESTKNQLKWTIQKGLKQNAHLAAKNTELEQKIKKFAKCTSTKLFRRMSQEMQQKQTQTEVNDHLQGNFLGQNYMVEHKSFLSMRSKNRKGAFIEIKQRIKNNEAEKALRDSVQKICELLLEKSANNQIRQKQREHIEMLFKNSRYEELIALIKMKLDGLYMQTFSFQNLKEGENLKKADKKVDKKTGKKSSSQKKPIKSKGIQELAQITYRQFGVQTIDQQTDLHQQQLKKNKGKNTKITKKDDQKHVKAQLGKAKGGPNLQLNKRIAQSTQSIFEQSELKDSVPLQKQNGVSLRTSGIDKNQIAKIKEHNEKQRMNSVKNKFNIATSRQNRAQVSQKSNTGMSLLRTQRNSPWCTPNKFRREKSQIQDIIDKFNIEQSNKNRFSEANSENHLIQSKNKRKKTRKVSNVMTNALFEQINIDSKNVKQSQYKKQMMLQKIQSERAKPHRGVLIDRNREESRLKQSLGQNEKERDKKERESLKKQDRSNEKVREIMIDIGVKRSECKDSIAQDLQKIEQPTRSTHQRHQSSV